MYVFVSIYANVCVRLCVCDFVLVCLCDSVGGLGGLYWVTSVSQDAKKLRETPLGAKLDLW